jgi:hypothetical protein
VPPEHPPEETSLVFKDDGNLAGKFFKPATDSRGVNDHLAIMERTGKILELILSGRKTIESRWTARKITPYENIIPGETLYFKNAGSNSCTPVIARATVDDVIFYGNLSREKMAGVIRQYGRRLCMSMKKDFQEIRSKRYCTMVFLKDAERLARPFLIDKAGYGGMGAAWITLPDIREIMRKAA